MGPGDIPGQGWTPLFASLARPVKRPRRRKFSAQFGSIGQNEQLRVLLVYEYYPAKTRLRSRLAMSLFSCWGLKSPSDTTAADKIAAKTARAEHETSGARGGVGRGARRRARRGHLGRAGHRCLRPGYIFDGGGGGVAPCLRGDNIKFISLWTCSRSDSLLKTRSSTCSGCANAPHSPAALQLAVL